MTHLTILQTSQYDTPHELTHLTILKLVEICVIQFDIDGLFFPIYIDLKSNKWLKNVATMADSIGSNTDLRKADADNNPNDNWRWLSISVNTFMWRFTN